MFSNLPLSCNFNERESHRVLLAKLPLKYSPFPLIPLWIAGRRARENLIGCLVASPKAWIAWSPAWVGQLANFTGTEKMGTRRQRSREEDRGGALRGSR